MPGKRKAPGGKRHGQQQKKKQKLKPKLFVYPEIQEGCDCKICTLRSEADSQPPPSPFHYYRLMKKELDGSVREATRAEIAEVKDVVKGMEFRPMKEKVWRETAVDIVKHLLADPASDSFIVRVDYEHFKIPDYPLLIKHPMDLRIIQRRLGLTPGPLPSHYLPPKYPPQPESDAKLYTHPKEFVSDVRMIWRNAYLYNKKDDLVWKSAQTMSRKFETKLLALWDEISPL